MSALGAFASAPTAALGARSRVSRRGALGTNDAKTDGIRLSTTVRIRGPRAQAVSTAVELLPPAIANSDSCSRANEFTVRKGAVPYKDEAVDCDIFVNDGAREAIRANGAESVCPPHRAEQPEAAQAPENHGRRLGPHRRPRQERRAPLPLARGVRGGQGAPRGGVPGGVRSQCGGEVLSGVAFVGDDMKDRAIDFMQRRPKTDFTMSKYNPLGRLHRDPDAIDYKQPGWMEAAMPGSGAPGDETTVQACNVWPARTCRSTRAVRCGRTCSVCCCSRRRRESGRTRFVRRRITRRDEEDAVVSESNREESAERGADHHEGVLVQEDEEGGPVRVSGRELHEERGPRSSCRTTNTCGSRILVCFDSFDMWHGAAKWSSESAKSDIKAELCNGAKGRDAREAGREQGAGVDGAQVQGEV